LITIRVIDEEDHKYEDCMQWQSGIMTINLAYHAQRTPWTIRSGLAGKGPCFITRVGELVIPGVIRSAVDAATCAANMNAPGYALHPLKGDLEGHWTVRVSGNWRLTFAFEGEDAILIDYQDYH
jgi:RelE-like toxin of type II toxin-antitoxin system HigB